LGGGCRAMKQSIAVLLGGPSAEHDVSLVSGRAVAAALTERGHPVEGWLVGLDGTWWQLPPEALARDLPAVAYDEPSRLGADGPHGAAAALATLAARDPQPVCFIALHGPFGEDGTVQALCESAGLVYTGSGPAASALGMDKALFKRLVEGQGWPVVRWREATAGDLAAAPVALLGGLAAFAEKLPDPRLMVKPARLGSSIGMTVVEHPDDAAELERALREAFRFDDRAVVEAYLEHARELEVSVVGNGAYDLEVYGPGEVFPGRAFYDYVAKYTDGVSTTTTTPDVEPALRTRTRELARAAYLAIGAEGFARVDFLVARWGPARGELFLNEINTIPGFTPISLFPLLCAEGGYDFGAICARIVELALERAARRPAARLTRADLP
jgi:D-alanine-D-alanine ligase